MANKIVVARANFDGKEYAGKREVELYDSNSKLTAEMLKHANKSLVLDVQAEIRQAIAVKYGFTKTTVAGKVMNTEDIESV